VAGLTRRRPVASNMKCIHTTGELVTTGQLKMPIMRGGASTTAILLSVGPLYYTEYSFTDAPQKWATAELAVAAGQIVDFREGKPTASPTRDVVMLVQCCDESNPAFNCTILGVDYAAVRMSFHKAAYDNNMKNDAGILQIIEWYQNKGFHLSQLVWTLTTKDKRWNNGKTTWSPYLTFGKALKPDSPMFLDVLRMFQ